MQVSLFKLRDNSSLLVIPLLYSQSVTTMALINAGPFYDPVGKEGLSHFIEHMFFKGSKKFPDSEKLTASLERKGASAQAFTYYQTNKYWIKSTSSDIELVTENITDRLYNSLFRAEDIETEKGVVKEEINILKSNPERLIWEVWSETVWSGSSFGRSYLGNHAAINKFSRKDVLDFVRVHYKGDKIIFAVCGDVQADKIYEIFNNLVDPKRNITKDKLKVSKAKKTREDFNLVRLKTENITVAIGFQTVNYIHKDRPVLELIAKLLAGGMSSRLRKKVMEPGLTYSIEGYSEHLTETGYFMIRFSTNKASLNKIFKIIYDEFRDLKRNLIKQDELELAKNYFIGSLKVNTETSYDFADWYANTFFLGGRILGLEDECRQIQKISSEDILRVAEEYFDFKKIKTAIVGDIDKNFVKVLYN